MSAIRDLVRAASIVVIGASQALRLLGPEDAVARTTQVFALAVSPVLGGLLVLEAGKSARRPKGPGGR